MDNYYIETDSIKQPISPPVILAHKSGRKIGVLNIDERTLVIKVELQDSEILYSECSFDVHKYINTFLNPLWNGVKNFKTVCIPISVPHIQAKSIWYEIEVTIDEEDDTVKHITGTLAQYAELDQVNNYEIEIRTEEDMARDDYKDTTFYNPDDPDASIVHRVLHDKAGHYVINHVDESLWDVKRTFSFNGSSVIDCLKELAETVDCIIILGENIDEDEWSLQRTISFYDGKDYCPECGKRGDFSNGCTNPECTHSQKIIPRYGKDTGIFVSKENLGESINLSVNTDNIKNCFRITAGDDEMTTAVILCNPANSRYIWRFTDDMRMDMSPELRERYSEYEQEYNTYKYEYTMSLVTRAADYNELYDKYLPLLKKELGHVARPIKGYIDLTTAYYYSTYLRDFLQNTMFPDSPDVVDTTAEKEMNKFTITTVGVRSLTGLSKSTTADDVEELVRVYVDDARYSIEVVTDTYEDKQWTGSITLTSFTDDEDTCTRTFNLTFTQATAEYLKDQVDIYMKRKDAVVSGAKDLFKQEDNIFKAEIKKYNLTSLIDMRAAAESVLLMLDDAGITQATAPDVYRDIYKPFSDKKDYLAQEITLKDTEVGMLNALIAQIEQQQDVINTALNLEDYLGETLWLELLSFRREADQSDSTIISQGLTEAEIIENAIEFYNRADEDIDKLTESVYEIDCTLKDLLLMLPDIYEERKIEFDVGNWLRIEVDDKIYKLRLLSYEIDFNNLTTIQTSFGTANRSNNTIYSTFNKMLRTTADNNQGLADISKRMTDAERTSAIVNQISSFTYTPDNRLVANIDGKTIIMNNDETLSEYLKRSIRDVNGALAIMLTNEFEGITTDEDGNNGDYSSCYTDVHIYYGDADITDSPDIEWDVAIPSSATSTWDATNHRVTVTNTTADIVIIEIFATYKDLEVKKVFTIKKIKQPSSPIVVNIDSSAGNIFNSRGINTILTCTVMKGTQDITDQVKNFHWIKYDKDGNEDPDWSRMSAQKITLSTADIQSKGIFKCEVSF